MTSNNPVTSNIFALIPEGKLDLLTSKDWNERKSTLELILQKSEEVNEFDKSLSYDELLDSLRKVLLFFLVHSQFKTHFSFHTNLDTGKGC